MTCRMMPDSMRDVILHHPAGHGSDLPVRSHQRGLGLPRNGARKRQGRHQGELGSRAASSALCLAYTIIRSTGGIRPLLAGGGFYESIGSALAGVNARTQSTVKWDNP